MNELSCLLFPTFSLFYLTPPKHPGHFYQSTSFLQTPLVYVFLGFILFLMESHLHKFMILTWLFTYIPNISRPCVRPRASRRDLGHYLGNYHEIFCIRTTDYSLLTRKLDLVHILPHPYVMTPISMYKKPRSNPLG